MKKMYLTANEVAEHLGISQGHAYRLIRDCNAELRREGYLTVAGKVPVKFFGKKCFGFEELVKEAEDVSISGQKN
jgi:predicted transcriptional regulator